jgi:hypothetical protein
MSVLFFWRGDHYEADMQQYGKSYDLNQNSEHFNNLGPGDHIWAFTRRKDKTYVLALDLIVTGITQNSKSSPGSKYGKYHADGSRQRSRYFDVQKGPSVEPLIRSLSLTADAQILGHSFQGENGVRLLTPADERSLTQFSSALPTI